TDNVALCPGALGKPSRITSGFPRSTITSPFTYRAVTSVASLSAVDAKANAETAIETAVAPPKTLRKLRRFIRFIGSSFFRFFRLLRKMGPGGPALWLKSPNPQVDPRSRERRAETTRGTDRKEEGRQE